jgi:hypothetical protein
MVEVLYGVRPARARTVSAFGVLPAARPGRRVRRAAAPRRDRIVTGCWDRVHGI